jgi:hypothetical protein
MAAVSRPPASAPTPKLIQLSLLDEVSLVVTGVV